jgi:hypothetical protein
MDRRLIGDMHTDYCFSILRITALDLDFRFGNYQ